MTKLRREYTDAGLEERDLEANPFKQFEQWFQEAIDAKIDKALSFLTAWIFVFLKPVIIIEVIMVYFIVYKSWRIPFTSSPDYDSSWTILPVIISDS